MMLELKGPAGRLEALLDEPEGAPRASVVFAHPLPTQGGTLHTKVVFRAAKALVGIGCSVLRFNFRGVGRSEGAFSDGAGECEDFRAALDFMQERYPSIEPWTAGFSFGSWVAMTVGAQDPRVSTLIGIGLPVDRYDFTPVETSSKPKFLIHGEEDEVCPLLAVRLFYSRLLEPKDLVVIEGTDHLFDGKVGDVGDAIVDLLEDYPENMP